MMGLSHHLILPWILSGHNPATGECSSPPLGGEVVAGGLSTDFGTGLSGLRGALVRGRGVAPSLKRLRFGEGRGEVAPGALRVFASG